jgi:hypothetical protein
MEEFVTMRGICSKTAAGEMPAAAAFGERDIQHEWQDADFQRQLCFA